MADMKILLIVAASVLLLVILLGLAGLLLPGTRTARAERIIAAPPAAIWARWFDLAGQPKWRAGLASVKVLESSPGRERWVEQPHRGPAIRFETARRMEGVEWTLAFSGPAEGRWTGRLEPLPNGRTRLHVEETSTVANPWLRLMARLFFDPQVFLENYLKELAAATEAPPPR